MILQAYRVKMGKNWAKMATAQTGYVQFEF